MWCEPSAFPPVLKYTQPAAELACRPAGTAGGAQGEQGILRPCPSSLGGVPGKPEVLLKAVAHPELSLTLRREQDQLMANVPSRIPRRMPTSGICYPTGLQMLSSEKKWLLKGALGRAPAFTPKFLAGALTRLRPTLSDPGLPLLPAFSAALCCRKEKFLCLQHGKQAGRPCETQHNSNTAYHSYPRIKHLLSPRSDVWYGPRFQDNDSTWS